MTDVLIVSNVLLWLAVVGGALLLLGLARQVGVLHERSAPLGAMMVDHGPDVGEESPVFNVRDFYDQPIRIGGQRIDGKESLIMFISPTCPMCNKLLPVAKSVSRSEEVEVILVSDGDREDHERFLEQHPLGGIPYVVASAIGMRYQIGKIPYAVLLNSEGTVKAKGLVNTREHLESLLEANRMGYASLQDYLKDPDSAKKTNGSGEATTTPAR
jgi:methylamine dehydrogenase accessory protein MauD